MSQKIGLNLPYNGTSLGNLGILISKVLYEREKNGNDLDISIFPIGGIDLSGWKEDKEFNAWIQSKVIKGMESWDRAVPTFKLWHLQSSLEGFSNRPCLLSFVETDRPTKAELNICRNNKVCFSSQYTIDTFKLYGIESYYLPLAFDDYNFKRIDKQYHADKSRIVFNTVGKGENRKGHKKIIQAWIKKYGNNSKYVLQCSIYNDFLVQNTPQGIVDYNNNFIASIVGNNKPYNVSFFPKIKENTVYNDLLNSAQICIAMSHSEAWGLPEFHACSMGRHIIALDGHGYKGWITPENAVLVKPTGKIDSADGVFFHPSQPFNQGSFLDWDETAFLDACDVAIKRVEQNPLNVEGLKLQENFNKDKFVDNILKYTLE